MQRNMYRVKSAPQSHNNRGGDENWIKMENNKPSGQWNPPAQPLDFEGDVTDIPDSSSGEEKPAQRNDLQNGLAASSSVVTG